jgi:LPS O-antigen subunit length determinant protein (WzzB/FepE family)|tara:strand:- start:1971 stop:2120 length:150 start_codon:yes stop_codon:yes gene_type:complete
MKEFSLKKVLEYIDIRKKYLKSRVKTQREGLRKNYERTDRNIKKKIKDG